MIRALFICLACLPTLVFGTVNIDTDAFGESLGGWDRTKKRSVTYELSGSRYRTYAPEISPTPGGGIFVSIRIDYRRSWMASDDHAVLTITFNKDGTVNNAHSTLAIQGRSISSDVIRNTTKAGTTIGAAAEVVKVGTDLVADLSSKLLRERIVEAGRVSFPSVIQHNFNLLYQAVRVQNTTPPDVMGAGVSKDEVVEPAKRAPQKDTKGLEIKNYGTN